VATYGAYGLGAAYLLVEVVKFLVNKLGPTRSMLTGHEKHCLEALYDMHNVKDESGRPIWYMPNQVGKQQEKIIEILGQVSNDQKEITHILERIIDRLDK